ncbi:MAG: T9SS type A sorting domain-containing protein [Bacteroidetes bacterium]|nr:T9SS type A sorting domain-containing protein [Bacteroidota bacterium]
MAKRLLALLVFYPLFAFSQLWQNDFSNPAEWISSDLNSGTDTWTIASSAIGSDVDSINSVSAGNGFAQFNSEGQCNATHQNVVLTYYQPIDISAYELSYVELVQHYKRKSDSVYVEFSNDGLTWESVRINQKYWYLQQTQNPDTVQVSIPASVQAAPFWMRFRFSGECGYAWLMDDLKIVEKEQYAIQASGRITSNGLGHVQIASCYTNSLDGSFLLTNFGYDTLFSISVHSDVYEDGIFESTQTDIIPLIKPLETIEFIQAGLIQGPLTTYADYKIQAAITNADAAAPLISDSIEISNASTNSYDGSVEGYLPMSAINKSGMGNLFIPDEPMCVVRPKLFIPDTTIFNGALVYAQVFRKNGPVWELVVTTDDYEVLTGDLGNWISFGVSFNDALNLLFMPGDTGLIFYQTYGWIHPIPYGAQETLGSYFTDLSGNLMFDPEGHAAFIQLNPFSWGSCDECWESIDENEAFSLVIYPNPATTEIQIQNITEPIQSIRIFSLDGREIYSIFKPGSETIPVSFLEAGTYFIFVETMDGTAFSEKFVKL